MRARQRFVLFAIAAACASLLLAWKAEPVSASPHKDYMLQCQGCHLPDGRGLPGSVPDLRDNLGLFVEVEGGRRFLIGVPGGAQSPLSNSELAELLNWMIAEFGPAKVRARFVPFTEEEVRRNRKPLADVESIRATLIGLIADCCRDGE